MKKITINITKNGVNASINSKQFGCMHYKESLLQHITSFFDGKFVTNEIFSEKKFEKFLQAQKL